MARQDIANMLTGMGGGSTRPNPNMSSSDWRMAFGAQQAKGLMNAAGTTTPQEAIQMGIGNLNLESVEGLQTLAQMQQIRGDMAGAAQTVSQIKAMQEKESKDDATVSYVEAVFPNKPELVDLAKKGISLAEIKSIGEGKKDYAVVGNNVYIPSTGEFIQGPKTKSGSASKPNKEFNEETGQNELVWRDPTDPTVVLKRVKAPTDTAGVTATVERIMKTNRELEQAERATELEATSLADEYEKITEQVSSGFFKTIEEGYKTLTGRQDKLSSLYLQADRLRVGRGVKNLPIGPASDKDVALVMGGELPANASPEEIIRYARGIAKLSRIARQDAALENSWYDRYGDARGLSSQREKEQLEESFVGFPVGAIAELEADMSDEAIKEFNEAFQVDYLDMRTKLERADKTLEELNRGF